MKDGLFHASGTPRFLKQRFQLPYRLSYTANCMKHKLVESTSTISDYITSLQGLDARHLYTVGNSHVFHVPLEGWGTIPILLDSLERFVKAKSVSSLKLESGSLDDLCRVLSEDVDDFLSTSSTMASTDCGDNACNGDDGHDSVSTNSRVEVSWITQVILMCWKRWRIRSRQTVQIMLQLFLFAALTALALGVLAVPTIHANSAVELSPERGKAGEISLVVGGGATLLNPFTSQQTLKHEFDAINASFNAQVVSSVWNSSAMTRHLYTQHQSSGNKNPPGAFVVYDALPFHWVVDWPYFQKYFHEAEKAYEGGVQNMSVTTNVSGLESLLGQTTGGAVELSEGFEMVFIVVLSACRSNSPICKVTLLDFFIRFLKGTIDSIVVSELRRERPRQNGTTRVLIRGSIHHNSSLPHSV